MTGSHSWVCMGCVSWSDRSLAESPSWQLSKSTSIGLGDDKINEWALEVCFPGGRFGLRFSLALGFSRSRKFSFGVGAGLGGRRRRRRSRKGTSWKFWGLLGSRGRTWGGGGSSSLCSRFSRPVSLGVWGGRGGGVVRGVGAGFRSSVRGVFLASTGSQAVDFALLNPLGAILSSGDPILVSGAVSDEGVFEAGKTGPSFRMAVAFGV